MKAIRRQLSIGCAWAAVITCLSACVGTTPVVEILEKPTAVEATREVEVIGTVTATSTPEPPTSTTPPTVTRTPVPIVEYSTDTVSFATEDGFKLYGTLFLSEGDTAIVFAHMAGDNDQENWIPFAKQTASRGFTSLTFDFRCYGESECGGTDSGPILLSRDLGAAIDFLRKQGFERIVCIGASMGGRGCVNVAFEEELVGLVVVSGTGSSHPDRQNLEDLASPEMPKLFIVSENDSVPDRTLEMTRLYESAPEPKIFKIFPGRAHGTELLAGPVFRETIFDFLEGLR